MQNTSGFFYCINCGTQASKFIKDEDYISKNEIRDFFKKLTDMESISHWGNTPDQRLAMSTYVKEWRKLKTKEWKL
jgi:hypothetical protein